MAYQEQTKKHAKQTSKQQTELEMAYHEQTTKYAKKTSKQQT